jgi:hypothetical protein
VKAFELKVYNEIKKSKVKNLSPSFCTRYKSAVKAQQTTIQRHCGAKVSEILKFRHKNCSGIQFEVLLSEIKNFKT